MITFRQKGDFSKTTAYFNKLKKSSVARILDSYGKQGVAALASATPVDSGLTASSWYYEVEIQNGKYTINFCNSNIKDGIPIAIILQYGHGTGTGGWVEGRDYINPAIVPVFDKITKSAWEEVTRL